MSSETATRVGPVLFQPLEQELKPVTQYLSGSLLNAGCGSREVNSYLLANGATEITSYDIASDDPEVIVGPLETMPFEDASFDSVLCNAVLEHVRDAERSLGEMTRVVRPGGHIVVAVPFLQPFHACPTDFRRYTADGLADLGRRAGLEVVCVLPVHSIAQTVGWILWEYAQEKGGRLRRSMAWWIAYLSTRWSNRTDPTLIKNANTFQAVFRQPVAMSHPDAAWRKRDLPSAVTSVPTMLIPDELRLLHYLAEEWYTGAGAIVEGGCFLGGSTVALADGLRRNLHLTSDVNTARGANGNGVEAVRIHSYDCFQIEGWNIGTYFPATAKEGESFRPLFDRNVAAYADLLEVNEGDVRDQRWTGGPIELLFVDIAKHWTTCDWITWQFFPHLIPGKSLVVHQDYLYTQWVAWLHVTMEFYADYFEYVCDTGVNSVVFRCTRRIPEDVFA